MEVDVDNPAPDIRMDAEHDHIAAAKIANLVEYLNDRAPTPNPYDDSTPVNMDSRGLESDCQQILLDTDFGHQYSGPLPDTSLTTVNPDSTLDDVNRSTQLQNHEIDDDVPKSMEGVETVRIKWIDDIIEEVRSSPDDVPSDQFSDMQITTPSALRITKESYYTTVDDNLEPDANGNLTPTMDNNCNGYLQPENTSMVPLQLPLEEPIHEIEYFDDFNEVSMDDDCVANNDASSNVILGIAELEAMLDMTQPMPPVETHNPSTDEQASDSSPDENTDVKKPGRPLDEDASEDAKKMRNYREEKKALDYAAPGYIYEALKCGLQLEEQKRIALCISYTIAIVTMAELYNWEQSILASIRYRQFSEVESITPKLESSNAESTRNPLGRRRKTDGKNVEKRVYQQKYKREKGPGVWFELLNDVLIELKTKCFNDYCDLMAGMKQKCQFLHDNLTGKCRRRLRSRTGSNQALGVPPNFVPYGKAAQKPARKKDGVRAGRVSKPPRPKGRTDHPPGIT